MNLPRHQVEERLAYIRAAIAADLPLAAVTARFQVARNNVRELMNRHGIALPASWVPRPTRKYGERLPDGAPFQPDCTADPAALSAEEREAAERFGLRFDRAAWLLQCEASGTAYGLRVTRANFTR